MRKIIIVKETFRTACDMNMTMHSKICLLFCHLVKKKDNQCLTVSQFDQYAVQILINRFVTNKYILLEGTWTS